MSSPLSDTPARPLHPLVLLDMNSVALSRNILDLDLFHQQISKIIANPGLHNAGKPPKHLKSGGVAHTVVNKLPVGAGSAKRYFEVKIVYTLLRANKSSTACDLKGNIVSGPFDVIRVLLTRIR